MLTGDGKRQLQTTNGLCPRGYYCEKGSAEPAPCPKGTYQPNEGAISKTSCKQCPAGEFSAEIGAEKCNQCQGSSRSFPESSTCQCIGLNRVYLRATGQCVCESGY